MVYRADATKSTIPRAKCRVCGEEFAVGARHEKVMADLAADLMRKQQRADVTSEMLCAFCYRLYQSARQEGHEIALEMKHFRED